MEPGQWGWLEAHSSCTDPVPSTVLQAPPLTLIQEPELVLVSLVELF